MIWFVLNENSPKLITCTRLVKMAKIEKGIPYTSKIECNSCKKSHFIIIIFPVFGIGG